MTEIEKLEARLSNTEKALFALATVIKPMQPPETQDSIDRIMGDYFDASTSLGFVPSLEFKWLNPEGA